MFYGCVVVVVVVVADAVEVFVVLSITLRRIRIDDQFIGFFT